jgi:hypothetical protein
MTGHRLVAVAGLFVLLGSSSAAAQGSGAPVRVSVQVVRTCRVTTATPQVSVDCGRRPQVVAVRNGQSPATLRALRASTEVAPSSARAVTIDF